jgi:YHS domain-containing protein
MTPQEIHDFKMKWMRDDPYHVRLHSDLESYGKDYCKQNFRPEQWKMSKWSDVYEHTFYFCSKNMAESFEKNFKKYANLPKI